MRLTTTLLLLTLPLPALAGPCDRWTAAMQQEEEGNVMTASICAGKTDPQFYLSLTCSGSSALSMRFLAVAPTSSPPDDYSSDMVIVIDGQSATIPARFESMDGAMAMDIALEGPQIERLQAGSELTLEDTGHQVSSARFTLTGSRPALDKLIATCSKQ